MPRFLFYSSPARGHLYPVVPTLRELRRRGHEVLVRTLSSEVARLRTLGVDAAPIDPAIDDADRVIDVIDRARYDGPEMRGALETERPDLVCIDINAWGAMAVAAHSDVPLASWSPCLMPLPSRDAPPYGPGLRPVSGRVGRARDRAVGSALTAIWNRSLPRLNAVRRELGVPELRSLVDSLLEPQLTLYFTAEPFEYPRTDWPGHVRLVGPGLWSPPEEPPSWLDEIDRPLVLVTCSTEFQGDGRLVEVALDALADEPVQVVATTAAVDPSSFSAPPNARVERFVPHGPLLERAVCVVCHGGLGITQKALAAGVPVCAVPFGRDQSEVARRVEVAGAGARLPRWWLTPARLRDAVRAAAFRGERAREIAAAFATAGGPTAAADALEAHAAASAAQRNGAAAAAHHLHAA
jgi:MGT family glycosyltransferase